LIIFAIILFAKGKKTDDIHKISLWGFKLESTNSDIFLLLVGLPLILFSLNFTRTPNAISTATEAIFNQPGAMPTVTIGTGQSPCNFGNIDTCWKTSAYAEEGEIIGVHIFYHNTSIVTAQDVTLSIQPGESNPTSKIVFKGGVASLSGPRCVGAALLTIKGKLPVKYIQGSARWHPFRNAGFPVNEKELFGRSGFLIGNVEPGEQGVLVANFLIGNIKKPTESY
jgi:hypothetical protein